MNYLLSLISGVICYCVGTYCLQWVGLGMLWRLWLVLLLIPCAYPDQEKSDAHEALALALAEQGLLKDAVHHWLQASRTRYDINKLVLITKYST